MTNTVIKKVFTEGELKGALTEMPQRFWDVIVFSIEDQIYGLELYSSAQLAMNHGAVSHVVGGIHYLRTLLEELDSARELKE